MTVWHRHPPGARGYSQRRIGWTDDLGIFPMEDRLDELWVMLAGTRGHPILANDDFQFAGARPTLCRFIPDPPGHDLSAPGSKWRTIETAPDYPAPYGLIGWCKLFGLYPMARRDDGTYTMLTSSKSAALKDGDNPDASVTVSPTHWQRLDDIAPGGAS